MSLIFVPLHIEIVLILPLNIFSKYRRLNESKSHFSINKITALKNLLEFIEIRQKSFTVFIYRILFITTVIFMTMLFMFLI